MTPENTQNKRLFALFLLGCLIFNFPIISLFNHDIFIFGIPILFIFLFFAWGLFIIVMVFITRILPKGQHKQNDEPKPRQKESVSPDQGPRC
jgi:hypothetical protein